MARSRRGETIFNPEVQVFDENIGRPDAGQDETAPNGLNPGSVNRNDLQTAVTTQAQGGRGRIAFQTGPTPGELAYVSELQKPEPHYIRPQLSTKRQVLGRVLEATRGGHRYGEELLYGPEARAKEDFGLALAERQRRLTGLAQTGAIESRRQAAENTALYRGVDIGIKERRNEREEMLLPGRMDLLRSQIGRNRQIGKAQEALATQRANAARAPFRELHVGSGTYSQQTGQVGVAPNPAQYRAAHPGSTRGNEVALAGVERWKETALKNQESFYSKQVAAIEKENLGRKPTLPDGTPNPLYTFDAKMGALNKQHEAQKQRIQNSYQEQLKRLHQNVNDFSYSEAGQEDFGDNEPQPNISGEMDQIDISDQQDAANPESQVEDSVTIETPDGRRGTIPASRLQEALEQGAKLINRGY